MVIVSGNENLGVLSENESLHHNELCQRYDALGGTFYTLLQDFLFYCFDSSHPYDAQQGNEQNRNEYTFEVILFSEFFAQSHEYAQDRLEGKTSCRSFLYSQILVPYDSLKDSWFGFHTSVSSTTRLMQNTQKAFQYRILRASLRDKVVPDHLLITTSHLTQMVHIDVKEFFGYSEVD